MLGWMSSRGKLASCGREETGRLGGTRIYASKPWTLIGQTQLCELCLLEAQESRWSEGAQGAEAQTPLAVAVSPVLLRILWFPRATWCSIKR